MVAKGTVDRGLMNEGIAPLGGEDLPFFLVVANVGVGAKRQQGDDHVQVVVWSNVVEHLGHQTFCGVKWTNGFEGRGVGYLGLNPKTE